MIMMLNIEKPMTMVVKQSRTVFQNTLPASYVLKRPQKQSPRTATRKNAAPLLVGFGQGEDRIHSPNESFSWLQFMLCRRWGHDILHALCGD